MTARTPEREALIRAEYPTAVDADAFLARLNALPGPPIPSHNALKEWTQKLRVLKTPETLRAIQRKCAELGGESVNKMTPERLAALPGLWNDKSLTLTAIYERINAMDGPHIKRTGGTLHRAAHRLGLEVPRSGAARPYVKVKRAQPRPKHEPPPPPPKPATLEEEFAWADAAIERRYEKARALLKARKDPHIISSNTGLPLREVFRLVGELRA